MITDNIKPLLLTKYTVCSNFLYLDRNYIDFLFVSWLSTVNKIKG